MMRFLSFLLFLVMATHILQGQEGHDSRFPAANKREQDSVARLISASPDMCSWGAYPTYGRYVEMMDSMAAAHPTICELYNIGNTLLGRSLLVMRITDHPERQEDEPELFYTSTMHGDEVVGYVMMLRLIDTLLSSYGRDERITNLVDSIDIFINPNANPDGTYGDDDLTLSGASRRNANGVDLNRNFPDPQDGPHPDGHDWQPETRAMMDFAREQHITLSANFHGGTEVANYPWDTWERTHVDSSWLRHISSIYAQSAQENSPEGYFALLTPSGIIKGTDWYSISGGRQDYMTYFKQAREITLEISETKIPSASALPDYWKYNREALLSYMEESLHGIRGMVTDKWGIPVHAMVEVIGHDQDRDSSMVFTDPDVGDYHRMIDSGSYDVRFSATDFQDTTVQDIQVINGKATRIDVVLNRVVQSTGQSGLVKHFVCYPNPFGEVLQVEIQLRHETEELSIQLADIQGRIIRHIEKTNMAAGLHRFTVRLSNHTFSPGMYFIHINTDSRIITRKVLHVR